MIKFFLVDNKQVPMLHLALVEAALERVPQRIWASPCVVRRAEKIGKPPGQILLDRAYHHRAMLTLDNHGKRGRPDLVHLSLLSALGTPLNYEGLLKIYVHTIDNYVITIDPKTRLPKNYNLFTGLFEQLYEHKYVPKKGRKLLTLKKMGVNSLISMVKPSHILAFSRHGTPKLLQHAYRNLVVDDELMAFVGAFPRGTFSKSIRMLSKELISIDKASLATWIVTSRIIYSYEQVFGVPQKRLGNIK